MKSIDQIKTDYNLFIDIQIAKYLKTVDKDSFSNDREARTVIEKIIEAYNKIIAPEHLKLDNLTLSAKTAWFNSIEVNYDEVYDIQLIEDSYNPEGEFENTENNNYGLFPFLEEDLFPLIVFIGPALRIYGLPLERFENLISGEEPTEIEEDLITWAVNIVLYVMGSIFEDTKESRKESFNMAIEIAMEFLTEQDAVEVVNEINAQINDVYNSEQQRKHKKRKKKKK